MLPLVHVMPRALRQIVRAAPLSHGKVDFAWQVAVGAAMARASAVRLEDGILIVEAQTPQWGSAVMRASSTILSRLQGTLGADVVREIRVRT